jgi:dihydropteroate synthase-like protein
MTSPLPRILFITGKLAEPALRAQVTALEARGLFTAEIAVMPITVAALMTTPWVARHIARHERIDRAILPGFCKGDVTAVEAVLGIPVEHGPRDLQDLPEYFGLGAKSPPILDAYRIEILAEINHAPTLTLAAILDLAKHYRKSGADIIDIGCDPGSAWSGLGDCVRMLKSEGFRVSVDSFNSDEVAAATTAGAELVLSVNGSNAVKAVGWFERSGAEVVAVPDTPTDLASLESTVEFLDRHGVPFRLDPVLEPIGFGFAASLGRYLEVRRRYPAVAMMMGVGNLTELTDADSAAINVILAGFCEEQGIASVLTTEVIPWARSSVKEFDLARRLVHHAVTHRLLPKRLEPNLVMLRDPKVPVQGQATLDELAKRITDPNYRIFAERGELHIMNSRMYARAMDPFDLLEQVLVSEPDIDASHAFYLGYELANAATALTLGKTYRQDQPLRWGFINIHDRERAHPDGNHRLRN